MPDLGSYAGAVLGAYAATLGMLALLVVVSALRGARVRRALAQLEFETRGSRDAPPSREVRTFPEAHDGRA